MKISEKSMLYLPCFLICTATMFIIVAITFWLGISNYTDGSPQETYAHFLLIVDRWMFAMIILGILPLTIFQWMSDKKETGDKLVSFLAGIVLCCYVLVFYSGESYIMQKYTAGELSTSKMFCKPTIETRIFDRLIYLQGSTPPAMCLPDKSNQKIK